jgi:hypothetical protein
MGELSDRYRAMLRWYPRAHRVEHEEEMLGVLMEAARPGQTRPTLKEMGDLIRGGIRVRGGRAIAADGQWRDALSVTGVIVPLFMCVNTIRIAVGWALFWPHNQVFTQVHPDWSAWAIWPLVAAFALLRMRRCAAFASLGATAWWLAIVATQYVVYDATAAVVAVWWPLLALTAVVGLAVRPGPRRGIEILARKKTLIGGLAALIIAAIITALPYGAIGDWTRWIGAVLAAVPGVAITGWFAVRSPVVRRVCVLVSTPVTAFVLVNKTNDVGSLSDYSLGSMLGILMSSVVVFVICALSIRPAERALRLTRRADD